MLQIDIDVQNNITLSFTNPASKQLTITRGLLVLPESLGSAEYDPEAVIAHGRGLRDALLDSKNVHAAFLAVLGATVRATPPLPLSIRLVLPSLSESKRLHKLAWEALLEPGDGDQPLLGRSNVYFSRYVQTTERISSPPVQPRALVFIANPERLTNEEVKADGVRLHPVKVEEELERARRSMRSLVLDAITSKPGQRGAASLDRLKSALSDSGTEPYHILYLVCHGANYGGKSQLWLDQSDAKPVDAQLLVDALQGLEPTRRPRLVVLAACQSAGQPGTGSESSVDRGELAAIGPKLVEQAGIPAVVAMQGNVFMRSVEVMMPAFFQELVRSGRVDRAMAAARGHMRIQTNLFIRAQWRVPVLYSCLVDPQLWPASQVKSRTVYLAHALQLGDAEDAARKQARQILEDGGFEVIESEPCPATSVLWSRRLLDGLGACDAAVLLLNERALTEPDNWVQMEARILCWRRWLEPDFRLIPLWLGENCPPGLPQAPWPFFGNPSEPSLIVITASDLGAQLREQLMPLHQEAPIESYWKLLGLQQTVTEQFERMKLANALRGAAQRLQAQYGLVVSQTYEDPALWWARAALCKGPRVLHDLYIDLLDHNQATARVTESIKALLGPVQPAWVDVAPVAQIVHLTGQTAKAPGSFALIGSEPEPDRWIAESYAARACGLAQDSFSKHPCLLLVFPVIGSSEHHTDRINIIRIGLKEALYQGDYTLWSNMRRSILGRRLISDKLAEQALITAGQEMVDRVIQGCVAERAKFGKPVLLVLSTATAHDLELLSMIHTSFGPVGFFFMGNLRPPAASEDSACLTAELPEEEAYQAYEAWFELNQMLNQPIGS